MRTHSQLPAHCLQMPYAWKYPLPHITWMHCKWYSTGIMPSVGQKIQTCESGRLKHHHTACRHTAQAHT